MHSRYYSDFVILRRESEGQGIGASQVLAGGTGEAGAHGGMGEPGARGGTGEPGARGGRGAEPHSGRRGWERSRVPRSTPALASVLRFRTNF